MALKLRGYDYVDEPDDVQQAGGFELGGLGGGSGADPGAVGDPGIDGDNSLLRINPDMLSNSRSGEKPRDRTDDGGGGSIATPRQPDKATPHTNSTMMATSGSIGGPRLRPFQPMADSGTGGWQGSGGLFGSLGGLQGGGLGRPLDPTVNEQSSISDLIKMLLGRGKF